MTQRIHLKTSLRELKNIFNALEVKFGKNDSLTDSIFIELKALNGDMVVEFAKND